jgi:DNA-binding PadR family transcriptional regulator
MNEPVPDEVLLGLIQARPAHGYDLLARFRSPAHLGRIWTLSTSQLYAVLKRLEGAGDIIGQTIRAPDAPPRTVYTITPAGRRRLMAWLEEADLPTGMRHIRVLFLSRLYIASLLGHPTGNIVAHQRAACTAQRQRLAARRTETPSAVEGLTLDFVLGQLDAALAWLARCETRLPLAVDSAQSPHKKGA